MKQILLKNLLQWVIFTALSLLLLSSAVGADTDELPLAADEVSKVITAIGEELRSKYIFPEVAAAMNRQLSKYQTNGRYSNITDPEKFAELLSDDMKTISKDKHFKVVFDPAYLRSRKSGKTEEEVQRPYLQAIRKENFGFKEVKILEGNVGYLNLTGFHDTSIAGDTAVAAMQFLSNTDAVIIDLRENGGGDPSMIQLITSYFFAEKPVHLNTFYWRLTDSYEQSWTLPYVPGKRRPSVDLYILTSNDTFSAAEEFSYNLRSLERAIIIGEVTGGGAHPGGFEIISDRFLVWIPNGRAINPITQDNWEGVGVQPHITVAADEAFDVAYSTALEKLSKRQ